MSAEALDAALARRSLGQFLRFALVGTAGFVVDATAFTAASGPMADASCPTLPLLPSPGP